MVFLAIYPTNQPILPNLGNQTIRRTSIEQSTNLRGWIAGWLVVDHPEKEVDAEEEGSVIVIERRRLLLERKEDRLNAFDAANNTC